jgi:hypothetical protein
LFADLARLERARTEVFDGADATPLWREDLTTRDPAEFPSLPLRLVPSSRVISMTTNADDVWDAIENEREIDGATAKIEGEPVENDGTSAKIEGEAMRNARVTPHVILVWRRELTVIHRTLDADEARIVPAMIEGTTFGAACELLDDETAAERAIELLVRWLDAQILRQ